MPSDTSRHKLTDWEWDGLTDGYNLADGHAHQEQNEAFLATINDLPALFLEAERKNQKDIQRAFEKAFFKLAGQHSYAKLCPPLYQAACSLSIEVVANYLRQTGKSVAMLHPTFDNLADILKRHDIPLTAIDEKAVLEPETYLNNLQADALFLVFPNNPTGLDITEAQYKKLIDICKKQHKLLIIDSSFRFYSSLTTWDQYAALQAAGIDFIVFEDTGKTWPTLELKLGITVASDTIYKQLEFITNDFLLNVSPFIFSLLTKYITADQANQATVTAKAAIAANKAELVKALEGLPLKLVTPDSCLSVAWLRLPQDWRATDFCLWLGKQGIHVLPGSPFYWNDQLQGESYIRIALSRPRENFKTAITHFHKTVPDYKPGC